MRIYDDRGRPNTLGILYIVNKTNYYECKSLMKICKFSVCRKKLVQICNTFYLVLVCEVFLM